MLMLTTALAAAAPTPVDVELANAEVKRAYARADPEVQEFVLHTARTFGKNRLWLNENALASLTPEKREERVVYLAKLFSESEYSRRLCASLAEAGALKDPRLVPGLIQVAAFHRDDQDYDCRPKWMAIAALARQESTVAVPLLVSLVDHGNQNTRLWARAALARIAHEDFKADKMAWNNWWMRAGHPSIEKRFLKPYVAPPPAK